MDHISYGKFKVSNETCHDLPLPLHGYMTIFQLDFGSRVVNVVDPYGTDFANSSDMDGAVFGVAGGLCQKKKKDEKGIVR